MLRKLALKYEKKKIGRIDIHDLSAVLIKKHGVETKSKHKSLVKSFFEKSDLDDSGDITLQEFLNYAKTHEKKLKLIFCNIDKDGDGKIDVQEVVKVLKDELGVAKVDVEGVKQVLRRYETFLRTFFASV